MRFTGIITVIIAGILFLGCDDDSLTPCSAGGEVDECLTDADGRLYYKEDIQAFVIRYFVPGTIDSFKTGVICKSEVAEVSSIELDKSLEVDVIFTGCFLDDKGDIQPTSFIGGEEFFYLQLTNASIKN